MNQKFNYKNLYEKLDLKYRKNPNFKLSKKEIKNCFNIIFENDDLETLKLLINNNIDIEDDILNDLAFIGNEKFFLIVNYIEKKYPNFNWNKNENIIDELIEINSSTIEMLFFISDKIGFDLDSPKNIHKLALKLCIFNREKMLLDLIKIKNVDILSNKYGDSILSYIENYMSEFFYLDVISKFI